MHGGGVSKWFTKLEEIFIHDLHEHGVVQKCKTHRVAWCTQKLSHALQKGANERQSARPFLKLFCWGHATRVLCVRIRTKSYITSIPILSLCFASCPFCTFKYSANLNVSGHGPPDQLSTRGASKVLWRHIMKEVVYIACRGEVGVIYFGFRRKRLDPSSGKTVRGERCSQDQHM